VVGSGYAAYREPLIALSGVSVSGGDPEALPHAADLARLAARDLARGLAVDAADARPVYLRDKVALTIAEQTAARAMRNA
jgi:tRNA threonylcarbamoyladenosine biosynthesis protein TsaB